MTDASVLSEICFSVFVLFFFFNDTATTEIYTLSLHDALPISRPMPETKTHPVHKAVREKARLDRKSTRLNSSHVSISYAVFCLKKKRSHDDRGRERAGRAGSSDRPDSPRRQDGRLLLIRPASTAVQAARFFFNDTATTEIYTLSLHDALPI